MSLLLDELLCASLPVASLRRALDEVARSELTVCSSLLLGATGPHLCLSNEIPTERDYSAEDSK